MKVERAHHVILLFKMGRHYIKLLISLREILICGDLHAIEIISTSVKLTAMKWFHGAFVSLRKGASSQLLHGFNWRSRLLASAVWSVRSFRAMAIPGGHTIQVFNGFFLFFEGHFNCAGFTGCE